jgi:hypothetical protein
MRRFSKSLSAYILFAVCLFVSQGTQAVRFTDITPGGSPLEGAGGVLDQLYGLGNLRRVSDDYEQLWLNKGGAAAAVGRFGTFDTTIGILPGASGSTAFDPVFQIGGSRLGATGVGALPPVGPAGTSVFRWGIRGSTSNPFLFSSREGDNPNLEDRMVTWLIINGTSKGNYVLGFEDFNDFNFADSVIEVSGVAPVPIPTALWLFASALGAFVLLGRIRGVENE